MNIPGLLTGSHPNSLAMFAGISSAIWSIRTPLLFFLSAVRDQFIAGRVVCESLKRKDDPGAWSYALLRSFAMCYLAMFRLRCSVKGALVLPGGQKILVANHPNATDAFFLPCILPERLYLLVQGNFFNFPVFGRVLSRAGQIPVSPERRALAFKQAYELLRQGRTVFLFPEGKLNPGQCPLQAWTGAVRLSLATGAPIIPVGIHVAESNTLCLVRRSTKEVHAGRWQVRGYCCFRFGELWDPSHEVVNAKGKQLARYLTDMLMEKIYILAQEARQDSGMSGYGADPIFDG